MQKTAELSDNIFTENINLDGLSLAVIVIMALILLLPFWRFKKRLILLCICLVISRAHTPIHLHPTLTVFDVGQGSAALLRFNDSEGRKQAWLFDTGARFPSGFSMAQSVILPNLQHYQIDRLDAAFLSHLDNDHAGGINILSEALIIDNLLTPQHLCNVNGFDRALFARTNIDVIVLWPEMPQNGDENNHSCVIKVTIGDMQIVFAGDIERQAEQDLVALYEDTDLLAADILIAPHHGSRTSSTEAFVKSVSPKYVVFAAGKPNRWGFPHDEVIARYAKQGSQMFHTGKQGAIEFEFLPEQTKVQSYREDKYNRWYFKVAN
jgi:competence protein ComEC